MFRLRSGVASPPGGPGNAAANLRHMLVLLSSPSVGVKHPLLLPRDKPQNMKGGLCH